MLFPRSLVRGGAICPIWFPSSSANQIFPSGPVMMFPWPWLPDGIGSDSVTTPAGVSRPIRLRACWVNHRFPSGPAVISPGWLAAVGIVNSVTVPAVVIVPIWFAAYSVNQRLVSAPGPRVIWLGALLPVGIGNSAKMAPEVSTLPIWLALVSVNQRFPSEPGAIQKG